MAAGSRAGGESRVCPPERHSTIAAHRQVQGVGLRSQLCSSGSGQGSSVWSRGVGNRTPGGSRPPLAGVTVHRQVVLASRGDLRRGQSRRRRDRALIGGGFFRVCGSLGSAGTSCSFPGASCTGSDGASSAVTGGGIRG